VANVAAPLTRANFGHIPELKPFVVARYGLVDFFLAKAGYVVFSLAKRLVTFHL